MSDTLLILSELRPCMQVIYLVRSAIIAAFLQVSNRVA